MFKKIIFILSAFVVWPSLHLHAAVEPETTILDLISVIAWRRDSRAVAVGTKYGIIHWWIYTEDATWEYNNSIQALPIEQCSTCKKPITIRRLSWQSPEFLNLNGYRLNIKKMNLVKSTSSSTPCYCQKETKQTQSPLEFESRDKKFKLAYRSGHGLYIESIPSER